MPGGPDDPIHQVRFGSDKARVILSIHRLLCVDRNPGRRLPGAQLVNFSASQHRRVSSRDGESAHFDAVAGAEAIVLLGSNQRTAGFIGHEHVAKTCALVLDRALDTHLVFPIVRL